jgi:hypothetical protein
MVIILVIGQGAFGEVWKGKWRNTSCVVKKQVSWYSSIDESEAMLMKYDY